MRRHVVGTLSLLAALAASCASGVKTSSEINPAVDLGKCRTYAFMSDHPMMVGQTEGPVSPMLEGQIMASIRTAMKAKGYREVARDSADLVLAFSVGARDKVRIDTYPSTGGYYGRRAGGYYGGWGVGWGNETYVDSYTEGQLAIDVFERATKTPAFHVAATKKITASDRENRQKTVDTIVTEALSHFPAVPGTGEAAAG